MMLYSLHGTQRYCQCEQVLWKIIKMTLVLEIPFNIAFCTLMLLAVKQTQGSPATIKINAKLSQKPQILTEEYFFSVIVDPLYSFLNTFEQ